MMPEPCPHCGLISCPNDPRDEPREEISREQRAEHEAFVRWLMNPRCDQRVSTTTDGCRACGADPGEMCYPE